MTLMHRFLRRMRRLRTLIGVITLTAVAAGAVAVVSLAVARERGAAGHAGADAARYTPAPLVTPEASRTAANSGPIVSIVGDDYSAGPTLTTGAQWTTLLQRDLGVQVAPLAVDGAGYLRSPSGGAEKTFSAQADDLPRDSRIVVFIGGGNDTGASTLTVQRAVGDAVSTAKERAPEARVFVIGPLVPGGTAPGSVTAVRDSIRSAAVAAGVTWVDPISRRWFSGSGDYVESDGLTLTALGERMLATRVESALESAVRKLKSNG